MTFWHPNIGHVRFFSGLIMCAASVAIFRAIGVLIYHLIQKIKLRLGVKVETGGLGLHRPPFFFIPSLLKNLALMYTWQLMDDLSESWRYNGGGRGVYFKKNLY